MGVYPYGGAKDFGIAISASGNGGSGGGSGSGVSGGWIFIIVLFGVTILYCAIGFGVNFKKGEEGMDRIPQRDFWTKLPGYVKDGCMVTAACLSGSIARLRGSSSAADDDDDDDLSDDEHTI